MQTCIFSSFTTYSSLFSPFATPLRCLGLLHRTRVSPTCQPFLSSCEHVKTRLAGSFRCHTSVSEFFLLMAAAGVAFSVLFGCPIYSVLVNALFLFSTRFSLLFFLLFALLLFHNGVRNKIKRGLVTHGILVPSYFFGKPV